MAPLLRILFLIPLGFICGCLAAGLSVVAPILFSVDAPVAMNVAFSIMTALFIAVSVGPMAAVPTLIAVIVAEFFAWRSFFFWTLLGGAIGLAGLNFGPTFEGAWTSGVGPLHFAAGLVGGAVYWLIAGRMSGNGIARARPAA